MTGTLRHVIRRCLPAAVAACLALPAGAAELRIGVAALSTSVQRAPTSRPTRWTCAARPDQLRASE